MKAEISVLWTQLRISPEDSHHGTDVAGSDGRFFGVEAIMAVELPAAFWCHSDHIERRAVAAARPKGYEGHRDQTTLEPSRIGRPEIHNHPLGVPSTPVSDQEFLPPAIAYLSAGGESPDPSTGSE